MQSEQQTLPASNNSTLTPTCYESTVPSLDQGDQAPAPTTPPLSGQDVSHDPSRATITPELSGEHLLSGLGRMRWDDGPITEDHSKFGRFLKKIKRTSAWHAQEWANTHLCATKLMEATRAIQDHGTRDDPKTKQSERLLGRQTSAIRALDRQVQVYGNQATHPYGLVEPQLRDSKVSDIMCTIHCASLLAHPKPVSGKLTDVETVHEFTKQMNHPSNRGLLEHSIDLVNGKSTAPVTAPGSSDVGEKTKQGD